MSQVTTALAPELLAAITAAEALITNLGSDPTKLALTAGPAFGIFLNTLALQATPALNATWGVAQADLLAKLAALKASHTPA